MGWGFLSVSWRLRHTDWPSHWASRSVGAFSFKWPWLVGLLALLFVMIGLNLSGYFEIGLGLQTMAVMSVGAARR